MSKRKLFIDLIISIRIQNFNFQCGYFYFVLTDYVQVNILVI